jgi:hypothetical protein
VRIQTLHISTCIACHGTIRGGSFLSSVLAAARLRRWLLTAAALPALS